MKFERFIDSKLFSFFENLYRIIVLNMITILFIVLGLGVFTLIPSLITLSICVKSVKHDTDFPLIKGYFLTFINIYKNTIKYSIFFIGLMILTLVNLYYLYCASNEWDNGIWTILYVVMLFVLIYEILAIINLGFVYSHFPSLSFIKTIKYSFLFIFFEFLKELIMVVLLISFIYLIAILPYIFSFIVVGLLYYINYNLIKNDFRRLMNDVNDELVVFKFIK